MQHMRVPTFNRSNDTDRANPFSRSHQVAYHNLVVSEVNRAAIDSSAGRAQLDRVVLNFIDLFKSSRAMFHTVFGLKPLVSPNLYCTPSLRSADAAVSMRAHK